MFGDMMGKLQEMKQKMEESKARLENITVKGESPNSLVQVTVNGNRKVKSIDIQQSLLDENDKDQLEDFLIIALNKALEQADKVNEAEMGSAAQGMMPNLGGLGNLFK